ncbi:Metallo-dependent phosphatase [Basidiobolus meristosporus CBS 931.73]|uniref:Metallo-dependent phosphatase n=1 Tax=Basidiobolus meristosporus CBS 931.73 TaxID=1314790 RepID=A0A1Y1XSX6_9FUNG|nr:Metallo-dependent phosphatase [Basidiobolus meristosporus CBS 931.73]|eukprot:ORX88867.1 Metallo-dependent phosphatase [Basidiobolus meristosporus CBS 931.73]
MKFIVALSALLSSSSLVLGQPINDGADSYITDIALKACDNTSCELPTPWHRIPLDLNKGAGGKYVYLHYRKDPGAKPVTSIVLLKDTDAVPSGYQKVDVNINEGTSKPKRYLAYTNTLTTSAPIQDLLVKLGTSPHALDGYRSYDFNMNEGAGEKATLFYQPKVDEVPISDIVVELCDSANCVKPGWIKSDHDLNINAGGKYVYLFYKQEKSPNYVTDITASTQTTISGYERLTADVNAGTKGQPVYLFYKKGTDQPIYSVTFESGKDLVDPFGYIKVNQDLNVGTGADEVYLYYRNKPLQLPQTPQLKFHDDGSFKILQLADLHMTSHRSGCYDVPTTGEWKSCTNLKTLEFAERMIKTESPDVIVFTGDNVMGSRDPRASVLKYANLAAKHGIPWAFVHGNHDDEGDLSRLELTQAALSVPYNLGRNGPYSLFGSGNYFAQVLDKNSQPAFTFYFVDSGAYNINGAGYDYIKDNQVNWFKDTTKQLVNSQGAKPNAIAFWHIPTTEYIEVSKVPEKQVGDKQENVASSNVKSPWVDALRESGDVRMTIVGHDHVNDYCFPYGTLQLCYGGGAGYGTYGATSKGWDRRSRVIQLSNFGQNIKTWKRKDDAALTAFNEQVIV